MLLLITILVGYILGFKLMSSWIYMNQNYHGPDSNIIRQNIYYQNGKYYRFYPEICIYVE